MLFADLSFDCGDAEALLVEEFDSQFYVVGVESLCGSHFKTPFSEFQETILR